MNIAKFLKAPFFTQHVRWQHSHFIAFENDEWCHFMVRIGSPMLVSFFLRVFRLFLFLSIFLTFFVDSTFFDFKKSLPILKKKALELFLGS